MNTPNILNPSFQKNGRGKRGGGEWKKDIPSILFIL